MAQVQVDARPRLGRGKVVESGGILTLSTEKTTVRIEQKQVVKRFTPARRGRHRCRLEVAALQRLRRTDGTPSLLQAHDDGLGITMTRVPGVPLNEGMQISDAAWLALRGIVESGLEAGVARHSLPTRDLLLQPDGRLGMVDFERVTLRRWRYNPVWLVARIIARHHLARRIGESAPHLLTETERKAMRWQMACRDLFTRMRKRIKGH